MPTTASKRNKNNRPAIEIDATGVANVTISPMRTPTTATPQPAKKKKKRKNATPSTLWHKPSERFGTRRPPKIDTATTRNEEK
jgi:hypothetical protein